MFCKNKRKKTLSRKRFGLHDLKRKLSCEAGNILQENKLNVGEPIKTENILQIIELQRYFLGFSPELNFIITSKNISLALTVQTMFK